MVFRVAYLTILFVAQAARSGRDRIAAAGSADAAAARIRAGDALAPLLPPAATARLLRHACGDAGGAGRGLWDARDGGAASARSRCSVRGFWRDVGSGEWRARSPAE